jgi:hypothetical protein
LNPRIPLARRVAMAGLLIPTLFVLSPLPAPAQEREDPPSGNGRLLTTDSAAVIAHPVLGLQRSAVPLGAGFALDTSLYADLLLAPNLGLRWAMEAGPNRFVIGARYTHFVGASVYSSYVESQEPSIQSFEPELSGPTVYGAYGLVLGPLTLQGEARYARYDSDYLAVTGAATLRLATAWTLIGEAGVRFGGGSKPRGAAGVRYGGESLGFALGLAYVDLQDPVFPSGGLPIAPAIDLTWTFR